MTDPSAEPGPPSLWDIHQPNTRRSLILCALGAILGLLVAGFGLFTAEGTRTFRIPPENAAMVNGVPVLMTDLVSHIVAVHALPYSQATAAQKRTALDAMIREELYVQRGVELGLPTDDSDVRGALVASAESVIAQDVATELPGERELRAWYAAHRDSYSSEGEMTLREFVVPPAAAPEVVAKLRDGATPGTLGLKTSGRVDDGAEFYFAAKAHLGDRIFAAAREMKDGAVSDPLPAPDGAHILIMQHNRLPVPTAYAASRDRVVQDFVKDKVARLHAANERFLRNRADIKIAPALR